MIRAATAAALAVALAACAAPESSGDGTPRYGDRQMPSVTEPGVHIGGYANVGVMRRF